jgi:two-component system sensor histidine kinase VicK
MKSKLVGVAAEYERGLVDYLRQRSESQLSEASRLGRLAMTEKLGVLDMIMIHHDVLSHLDSAGRGDPPETLSASSLFLCEALSSYEMAHRGFQDVAESVIRMTQFALVVCHELRSPLTSIVTSLGMLQEILAAHPDSNEGKLISNAMKSASILKSRTEDLQDLVSYRAGILSLKPAMVDVAALLQGVVSRLEPLGRKVGVAINLQTAENLPVISADPNRLEQIVSNIVNNALKYAADGRRVDVRAFARDDMMVIEMQDYGPGIDPSARARLFQANPRKVADSSDVTGMGIGLALCRELAGLHGGTITVVTEEGKGSTFTVALPVSRRAGEQ